MERINRKEKEREGEREKELKKNGIVHIYIL